MRERENKGMVDKKSNGKKWNPKFGSGFTNDAFGEGAILVQIDAEAFDSLMKNVQVGSALLLRKNKVTTKGNTHYWTEILPPMPAKANSID
jgi:hypothetical protein